MSGLTKVPSTLGQVGKIYRVAQSTPEAAQYECADLSGYPLILPKSSIVWWEKSANLNKKRLY